jgi:hypothetical protein
MKLEEAYLYGLITGRGHIYSDTNFIAIEFSHANEFIDGIAHCPKCGYLATKPKNSKENFLVCKKDSCKTKVDPSVKKRYNQPFDTLYSLENIIIPFLSSAIQASFEISANKSMTLLLIDFSLNQDLFKRIISSFYPAQSFDSFKIPQEIKNSSIDRKIEFVNGLLDTSGFANAGGWLNRDGQNNHGRMRAYFQIVRNWHLPVEIDNFLRDNFNLPIHTIDWGHPNIRDGNLEEYYGDNKSASWSREHQVKFFPEYFGAFKFRITSKQSLFSELLQHNLQAVFNKNEDWFPPSKFGLAQVKAEHPGENDPRIPIEVRRHVNAFWQINLLMGCKYLQRLQSNCVHPEMFALNGEDADRFEETKLLFDQKSKKLHDDRFAFFQDKKRSEKTQPSKRKARQTPEAETYAPLVSFFNTHLATKYSQNVTTFDTSAGNLNAFLKNKASNILETFENCEKFRIRPDVVSFLENDKKLVFVESKVTPLDLLALGQLIGYCLVAQPLEAILISTQLPSPNFLRILKANKTLLQYSTDRFIKIATLTKTNNVIFTEI